jgi:membrane-associated phospholipid phosphatase
VVWTSGFLTAAAVGYLRIAADKHYFSDVMLGAIVGTALGAGLPLLFHRPESEPGPTSSARAPLSPASFSFSGTW